MRRGRRSSLLAWAAALVILATTSGCGGEDELASPTARRLKFLATVYLDYAVARRQAPANEQELQNHLEQMPDFARQASGLTAEEDFLVSARDGVPFVVRYGVPLGPINGATAMLVAYEEKGHEGQRLAVYANGKVELLDAAALEKLVPES